ncbi:putative disease resistance RPP13-like protein 3 [Carex rostrata]
MAEAAVSLVLHKLNDTLEMKAQELHHVNEQITQMKQDLDKIKAYLRDANSQRKGDELVKKWVIRVRDIAYRIEDVIDTFLVEIEENRSKNSCRLIKIIQTAVKKSFKMNKLGGELKEIISNLNSIDQCRPSHLRKTDLGVGNEEICCLPLRLTKPYDVDDSEIVGLEADKNQILMQLLDSKISRRMVLSIVGTGGLGKTTLAKLVYSSVHSKRQFDCCTWLSISSKFNVKNLLREIIYSIKPKMKHQDPTMTYKDLRAMLNRSLSRKRYLIILDDVWTTDLWEQLKLALPDENNASRVIITTRMLDVAIAADCNTKPYRLHYLDDNDSLALLFQKAFQQHIQPENYLPSLLEVAKKLTKKCGGLPLALVVLGNILARRDPTYTAWSNAELTMDWHNEDESNCSKVLAMSYEDLPYHLKPCFLYFASFPENHKISGKHVTRMWLAEGFVPKYGDGTMEDRAEGFLEELIKRCLVQVTEKSWTDNYKYCSMHILLRDLAIHQAKEENFFTIFSTAEDGKRLASIKPRRAAVQFCTPMEHGAYSENTRSLVYFGFAPNSSNYNGFRVLNYTGFRLLRVLTIEGVKMKKFSSRDLIHLRYLGIRYCTIGPKIFGKNSFYNLETIDFKGTHLDHSKETTHRFDAIIPTLRHVYVCKDFEKSFQLKWDDLTNLQTLKGVGHGEVPRLGSTIKNMRTLGILYGREKPGDPILQPSENWKTLMNVLKKTEQLVSLKIVATDGCLLPFATDELYTNNLPCHERIKNLHLGGVWGVVPSFLMFPTSLIKLTLEFSKLQEDPLPIFGRLVSLRILQLRDNSYLGTKLRCSTGQFPNLKKLELKHLPKLCQWEVEEGTMPILSHLKIDCPKLNELPEPMKVRSLEELIVRGPSGELQNHMQGGYPEKKEQNLQEPLSSGPVEQQLRMQGEDPGGMVRTPHVPLNRGPSRELKHHLQGETRGQNVQTLQGPVFTDPSRELHRMPEKEEDKMLSNVEEEDLLREFQELLENCPSHELQHHIQGEDPRQKVRALEELLVKGPSRELQRRIQGEDLKKKVVRLQKLLEYSTSRELQHRIHEEDLRQKVRTLEEILVNGPSRELQQHMQGEDLAQKMQTLRKLLVHCPLRELLQHIQEEDPRQKVQALEELLIKGPSRELQQHVGGEDPRQKVQDLQELLIKGPSRELRQHIGGEDPRQKVQALRELLLN